MPIYCNMSNLHRIFCGIQHKLMRNSAGKLPYLGFYTYVKDERYKKTNDITLDILPGKLTLKRFQSPNACREFSHFAYAYSGKSPNGTTWWCMPHAFRLNELTLQHRNAVNYSCCYCHIQRVPHNVIVCRTLHSNNANTTKRLCASVNHFESKFCWNI